MHNLKKEIMKFKNKKNITTYFLIIILILIVLFQHILIRDFNNQIGDPRPTAVLIITSLPNETDPVAVHISPSPQNKQSGISIPVQDKLNFISDTIYQDVSFVNPSENNCNFVVSLTLPDNKTIYKSRLIPPGMAIYRIELKDTLVKGEFKDAILTYECYREDGTKLNSAVFKVDITVK